MGLPSEPVTLSVADIDTLNRQLAKMRHDINNNLSLMVAAMELVRFKPDTVTKMLDTLSQQPPRITENLSQFTAEFEKMLHITRP